MTPTTTRSVFRDSSKTLMVIAESTNVPMPFGEGRTFSETPTPTAPGKMTSFKNAEAVVGGAAPGPNYAYALDPFFGNQYPGTKSVVNAAGNLVDMPVAPFQYLNTHDHSHLIVFAGTAGSGVLASGDRSGY
jgi:hypothetical protein